VEIEPKEKFKKVDARQFGKERRLMAQHDMRLKQRTTQAQWDCLNARCLWLSMRNS
jgi:hypothetical protein